MAVSSPRYVGNVRVPTKPTLRKYGLLEADWLALLEAQNYSCGVCGKVPKSGVLHIDHQHVRLWRRMPPEQRRLYVRGLLDFQCNSSLRYRIDSKWLESAKKYIDNYSAGR